MMDDFDDALGEVRRDTVLEKASRYGLRLNSGARSPQHNAAVGGVKNSYHLTGNAGDFVGSRENMKAFHDDLRANHPDLAELLDESDHIHVAWHGASVGGAKTVKPTSQPVASAPDEFDSAWESVKAKPATGFSAGKVGNLAGATVPQSGSTPRITAAAPVVGVKKMPKVGLGAEQAAPSLQPLNPVAQIAERVTAEPNIWQQRAGELKAEVSPYRQRAAAIQFMPQVDWKAKARAIQKPPLRVPQVSSVTGRAIPDMPPVAPPPPETPEERRQRNLELARQAEDKKHNPVTNLLRHTGADIVSGLAELPAGLYGAATRGLAELSGETPASQALKQSGQQAVQNVEDYRTEYGGRGVASNLVHGGAAMAPQFALASLLPGSQVLTKAGLPHDAVGFATASAADAYGHGASIEDSIKSGLEAAAMMKLAGKLSENVTESGLRGYLKRAAANTAAPSLARMAVGGAPVPSIEDAAFGAIFAGMHGGGRAEQQRVNEARRESGRQIGEGEIPVTAAPPRLVKRAPIQPSSQSSTGRALDLTARFLPPGGTEAPSPVLMPPLIQRGEGYARIEPHLRAVWDEVVGKDENSKLLQSAETERQAESAPVAGGERLEPQAEGAYKAEEDAAPEVTHHSQAQERADDGTFSGPPDASYTPKAERSLPQTLDEAKFEGGENREYSPVSNRAALDAADTIISDKGLDGAVEWVKAEKQPSAEHTATGIRLIGKLQEEGRKLEATDKATSDRRVRQAIEVASELSERLTKQGQAIQAVKVINQLSPERALLVAERLAKKSKRGLSPDDARRFEELATKAQASETRANHLQAEVDRLSQVKPSTAKPTAAKRIQSRADAAFEKLQSRLGNLNLPGVESLRRPSERGAATLKATGQLVGDAELLAEYGAAQLRSFDLSGWKQHMQDTFGPDVAPVLDSIAQRAYEIRVEERAAELAERFNDRGLRKTAEDEIAGEIRATTLAARKAEQEARQATAAEARAKTKEQRETEKEQRKRLAADARARADEARDVAREARKQQARAYREQISRERKEANLSASWLGPIKEAARTAKDSPIPSHADLVAIAAERIAPEKPNQAVRRGLYPGRFYREMAADYGVSKKNAQRIYKEAYQRVEDARSAAREASRIRSITKGEASALTDAQLQSVLFQHAEAQRQAIEARSELAREFARLNRSKTERVVSEILNAPRSLQSSIDAPLGRQGLMYLVTHPIITVRDVVPEMMRAYKASKATYAQMVRDMESHPDYDLFTRSGGEITATADTVDPRYHAEESFQSEVASRLLHVRLSEQAYNHALNLQRLNVFSRYADIMRAKGYTAETNAEAFQQAARLANIATGRGQLPEFLQRSSALLSGLGYAPRLLSSRIQLLNMMVNPRSYMKLDPAVRRIAAGEFVKFAGVLALTAAVAQQMGASVSMNPDDGDFLKIRVGKTTYDLTGGLGNVLRFGFRAMRAVVKRVEGAPVADKDQLWEVTKTFVRSKMAPIPGTVVNLYAGKDVVGKPANVSFSGGFSKVMNENQLVKLVTPMVVGDFVDAASEEGPMGVAKNLPALAGFGTQNYLNAPEVQQFYRDFSVGKELAKGGNAADVSYFESLKDAAKTLTVLRKERDAVESDVEKRDELTLKMRQVAADALKTKGEIDPGVDAKLKAKQLGAEGKIDEAEDVLDEAVSSGNLSPRVADATMKTASEGVQSYTEGAISRASLLKAIEIFNALPREKQTDRMIQAIDRKFSRFNPDTIRGKDAPRIDAAAKDFYSRFDARLSELEAKQ